MIDISELSAWAYPPQKTLGTNGTENGLPLECKYDGRVITTSPFLSGWTVSITWTENKRIGP